MNKNLKVKCPGCNIVFLYYQSEFRPFCCERCKQIDLGHWFKESYVVPVTPKENENVNEEKNESIEEENNESEYE